MASQERSYTGLVRYSVRDCIHKINVIFFSDDEEIPPEAFERVNFSAIFSPDFFVWPEVPNVDWRKLGLFLYLDACRSRGQLHLVGPLDPSNSLSPVLFVCLWQTFMLTLEFW